MKDNDIKIDLHIHSNNSDGTYTTQQLLDILEEKGADYISFTDHDSVDCYYDIINGRAKLYSGVTLIPGIEFSCKEDNCLRDILGYGISIPYVENYLRNKYSHENRLRKQQLILENLKSICRNKALEFDESICVKDGKKAEGFIVMSNELNRYPSNIERFPFIANNIDFYWNHFSKRDSDFFVDATFDLPDFKEVVNVIHESGGLACLAHPFVYGISETAVDMLVEKAVKAGIDGIELKHTSNIKSHITKIREYAKKYNLVYSGGTDFHGATKPHLELITGYGNIQVNYNEVKSLINKINKKYTSKDINKLLETQ